MQVRVYAKINMSLYVTGRAAGYHTLDSVVASVNVFDMVTVQKSDRLSVTFQSGLLSEKTNAYKVAQYMSERYDLCGAEIFIEDNIPSGCGLGGSSADCAGVILALNGLFDLKLSLAEMSEIALKFGSDTAYMLTGGFARMQGRGEILTPFDGKFATPITIAYKGGVSTAECFALFDHAPSDEIGDNARLIDSIKRGECDFSLISNHLESAARKLNGSIGEIIDLSTPYPAVMTGSGAAVVIYGQNERLRERLLAIGANVIETEIIGRGTDFRF